MVKVHQGPATVEDVVVQVETEEGIKDITMMQRWPVRRGRPYKEKLSPEVPLITGQRIIDTFFTVTKGGTACIPGPFGSGKTVVQHQLAKWADADIIVYVGCGERGNEMTDVLREFPELKDPRSGEPLMKRTVLVANTSDMPVAAREASIYTGITIAEYFRDMGYNVALMADSTSRWAEALREMSGRLEEMPGDEGYPAYLGSRLAEFYERAGRVTTIGSEEREGSLTVGRGRLTTWRRPVGARHPGDLADREGLLELGCIPGLRPALPGDQLAHQLFPLLRSGQGVFRPQCGCRVCGAAGTAMRLLQQEAELEEIVRLIGLDALSEEDRLILETAKSIREDFLHQNAFHEVDTYSSLEKQHRMLRLVLRFHEEAQRAIGGGVSIEDILQLEVRERIARAKYVPEEELDRLLAIEGEITTQIDGLIQGIGGEKSA